MKLNKHIPHSETSDVIVLWCHLGMEHEMDIIDLGWFNTSWKYHPKISLNAWQYWPSPNMSSEWSQTLPTSFYFFLFYQILCSLTYKHLQSSIGWQWIRLRAWFFHFLASKTCLQYVQWTYFCSLCPLALVAGNARCWFAIVQRGFPQAVSVMLCDGQSIAKMSHNGHLTFQCVILGHTFRCFLDSIFLCCSSFVTLYNEWNIATNEA